MQAEDVLAAVFPDAAACLENIAGDREVPDHPLVRQALHDCLYEAMDIERLENLLRAVHGGTLRLLARDTPEPSPICHELLNARPYAFLDDAPLEERRAHAVYTRRSLEPSSAGDLGALDIAAIERVRDEAAPTAESADELHDVLLTCGFVTEVEGRASGWLSMFDALHSCGRATALDAGAQALWFATERLPEARAVLYSEAAVPREEAIRELLRGRLEVSGPITASALGAPLGIPVHEAEAALLALEAQGAVLRGSFTPGQDEREWCDRRLLARIHRYTLNRLRAEIEPVSVADFVRFLFRWQHIEPGHRVAGVEGLFSVIDQLQGFEAQAAAWESDLLPARCDTYAPDQLDLLSATGRVMWGRLSVPDAAPPGLLRSSPIALLVRADAGVWLAPHDNLAELGSDAAQVLEVLERRGASFAHELAAGARLLPTQIERALAELAAAGLVTSDGFTGLRALLTPSERRAPVAGYRRRGTIAPWSVESAGRWARFAATPPESDDARVRTIVHTLLRRWGVLFRRLLEREPGAPAWRDVVLLCRRMEARGEIRGGRFVASVTGEQFALPEAVPMLRAVRREEASSVMLGVGAADPVNLTGILLPGDRIAATAANRIAFRAGIPVAVLENQRFRALRSLDAREERAARDALARSQMPPVLRSYLKQGGRGRAPKQAAS
jgi:ATP-dependent Lhr-like helicase